MKTFLAGLASGILLGAIATFWLICSPAPPVAKPDVRAELPDKPLHNAEDLSAFLDELPYEIGFYAKQLRAGETVERFADRSVALASMVKVFCLTELFRQKEAEGLDLAQKIEIPPHGELSLLAAADLMIGVSDNPTTYALLEFLGYDQVNAIPQQLGIEAMSVDILPRNPVLRETLDKRVFGDRIAPEGLPQHGTARGMSRYYELLAGKQVLSEAVSTDLLEFFARHPKPFSSHYPGEYSFIGKGGNLLWTRPPKHYSMLGWGLLIEESPEDRVALCVWGEWFPEDVGKDKQSELLKYVTDCLLTILNE